ncbi:hypothetical protein COOONC_15272 [Cooperia oncophora]
MFQIQVELSPSSSPQGSSQQLSNEPPAEIEWSPARQTMDTVVPKPAIHSNPSVMQEIDLLKTRKVSAGSDSALLTKKPYVKSASLDETYESSPSPRRNSSNERARQNLLAQRRQSQIQMVQEMSGRQTTTTLIPLTCAQIHLIRSLWRQIYTSKGPTVIGSSIYHRLCFKCPQVGFWGNSQLTVGVSAEKKTVGKMITFNGTFRNHPRQKLSFQSENSCSGSFS